MINLTEEQAHVVLDALAALQASITKGAMPWRDYDYDGDDSLASDRTYTALIDQARTTVESVLAEHPQPLRVVVGEHDDTTAPGIQEVIDGHAESFDVVASGPDGATVTVQFRLPADVPATAQVW